MPAPPYSFSPASPAAKSPPQPKAAPIAIQPLGKVSAERLATVKTGLEKSFGLGVELLPALPLPKEAWYEPRERYRAEKLLTHLDAKAPAAHTVVIGITEKDISTTKDEHEDWGIFGLGDLVGRACVVSTFRLSARGADEAKLRERLRKVAIHEVGHVAGLPHCPQAGCVMRDAESSIATVDEENGEFCPDCKERGQAGLTKKTQARVK
ncbi:archaemetzincin [Haloferula sp. BvORR071]|uniref:archaemetzincin n=1 Tax=Haloferula sp. BvORR071 TaxID=1396141 RepID=UPI00069812AE|nr:archaemetzincin [Haloferula sp. BvORR071]